jgi:molecular chaperone GrpE
MDDRIKQALLSRFSAYLDTAADTQEPADEPGTDLYTVFVELAGLRSEVRTESRLVKEALDQFRSVFATLQAGNAATQQELDRVRSEARDHVNAALRPLLLDVIDLRDRLTAALKLAGSVRPGWRDRLLRRHATGGDAWQDGLRMILRRLDQVLLDRHVVPLVLLGRSFDPRQARAVATADTNGVAEGVVVEEIRTGYLWEDQVLRTADVIVSKRAANQGEAS